MRLLRNFLAAALPMRVLQLEYMVPSQEKYLLEANVSHGCPNRQKLRFRTFGKRHVNDLQNVSVATQIHGIDGEP